MSADDHEETRAMWNAVADDWLLQVGDEGDSNRRLNSDPVLWAFAGDVAGLAVLDAGCGTGYLSKKLRDRGALVTGIDFSERMMAIASSRYPEIDFRIDSCSELATLADQQFDMLVSNYVLMDTPDLQATMAAFHRVLKTDAVAVLVFSHPCFPQDWAAVAEDGAVCYRWPHSYFEERKYTAPPMGTFQVGLHLVSATAFRLLESVHEGGIHCCGLGGAQNCGGPLPSRNERSKSAE